MMMKRILSSLLILSLTLAGFALAAEAEPQPLDVSLDTMEALVKEYSPDIQKAANDYQTAKDNYYEIVNTMSDLQSRIQGGSFATGLQYSAQYSSLKDSCDRAQLSMFTARESYRLTVSRQILSAKQAYLTYFIDSQKLALTRKQQEISADTLARARQKLSAGYLSQEAYDTMEESAADLKDTERAQQTSMDTDLRKLRTLLGLGADSELVLKQPDSTQWDLGKIAALDLDADLSVMLENSASIQIAALTYESYCDHDYALHSEIENALIACEQAEKTARESMTSLFDSLQNSFHALNTARTKLSARQRDLASAEKKCASGYLSSQAVEDIKNEVKTMELNESIQELSLMSLWLSYEQMKDA